jgi:hypothetical protein
MRGFAVAALVGVIACSGVRPGIINDGGSRTNQASDGGCGRDENSLACSGIGYDDIALVALVTTVATVLVTNKLRRH